MLLIGMYQHSMTPLLHHSMSSYDLIRPCEHVRRYCQADLLCRFEIDDELELRRLLHREIGGLSALEDSVHTAAYALPFMADMSMHGRIFDTL